MLISQARRAKTFGFRAPTLDGSKHELATDEELDKIIIALASHEVARRCQTITRTWGRSLVNREQGCGQAASTLIQSSRPAGFSAYLSCRRIKCDAASPTPFGLQVGRAEAKQIVRVGDKNPPQPIRRRASFISADRCLCPCICALCPRSIQLGSLSSPCLRFCKLGLVRLSPFHPCHADLADLAGVTA